MASKLKDKIEALKPGSSTDAADTTSISSSNGSNSDTTTEKYMLRVSAGPSYDVSTHKPVIVNGDVPTAFENEYMTTKVKVRIRNYKGLPRTSLSHSPYFDDAKHVKDQYSIGFSFVPKRDIPAAGTVWGNDFDHPIRDRLPPGINQAVWIVKEFIDQGIECDAYADEPWLFAPALDCWFILRIGEIMIEEQKRDIPHVSESEPLVEGADGSGVELRKRLGLPDSSDKRRKHFVKPAASESFTFEKDRLYEGDFFNPYIDFSKYSLKLPGFTLKCIKYINDKTHNLRYVFKNRINGEVYFVVVITLLFGEELEQALREEGERSRSASSDDSTAEAAVDVVDERDGAFVDGAIIDGGTVGNATVDEAIVDDAAFDEATVVEDTVENTTVDETDEATVAGASINEGHEDKAQPEVELVDGVKAMGLQLDENKDSANPATTIS
ncbi:DUF1769-domain-containing protein [Tothia fuscella]|uniref:DUF1769-domain-containing protein n=1 Tax=Tothia fuscella TaxID=1048955 RepID=A0A9P4P1Z1_9PEZI|nr:DUF1769-domain-containing protein [Tothia fuscella]